MKAHPVDPDQDQDPDPDPLVDRHPDRLAGRPAGQGPLAHPETRTNRIWVHLEDLLEGPLVRRCREDRASL